MPESKKSDTRPSIVIKDKNPPPPPVVRTLIEFRLVIDLNINIKSDTGNSSSKDSQ